MRTVRSATAQRTGVSGWQSFWPKPRIRRPIDGARLALSAAALTGLVLLAGLDAGLLSASSRLVPAAAWGLPRTLLSVADVVTSLAVLAVVIVIAVDALRWRRFALTS